MDAWLICSIIALLIGLPIYLSGKRFKLDPEPDQADYQPSRYGLADPYDAALKEWKEKRTFKAGALTLGRVILAVALFLLIMASFKIVPTNTIGIVTSFGKPVDAKPNGFQVKAPWQKVAEFDASRQYLKFVGGGNNKTPAEDGKEFPCIQVKMEREAKGCINVVIGWQLRAGTAAERQQSVELFKAHKTFDRLTENFMAANARSATTAVYDLVNPLVPEKNPTFAQLSKQLDTKLKELVSDEVTIISAQVTGADYDDTTDKRIADMQSEYAKTEQAKQQELTNRAVSAANAALVQSLTPEVLQAECLKIARETGTTPGACLQPGWGGTAPTPQQPAK